MNNPTFNLVDNDWIPVQFRDGTCGRVSLMRFFERGGDIADLAVCAYERIALMRLLVCIGMAALGEEKLQDEEAWFNAKDALGPSAVDYLGTWRGRFNLYGARAFMQPDGLTADDSAKANVRKIFIHLSAGNNDTLYDHDALRDKQDMADEDLALALLVYLNFSAGGQHSKCFWDRKETSVSVTLGPAREKSMLHAFVLGGTVLESVWLNLLSCEQVQALPNCSFGRPLWECKDLSRASLEGKGFEKTLEGRLVPFSRITKLSPGCTDVPLGEGLKYEGLESGFREPAGTVLAFSNEKKGDKFSYLSANPGQLPWRNLKAILAHAGNNKGALALDHVVTLDGEAFSIWIGGMACDKSKNEAVVEWRATFPAAILEEESKILSRYETGIQAANEQAVRLKNATHDYAADMKVMGGVFAAPAIRFFWDDLATHQRELLVLAEDDNKPLEDWHKTVFHAARTAYEHACPHQSARQLQAFVAGRRKLYPKKGSKA